MQGLALGGEYGGAATYVAEHAPPGKRGFFTSWIQTTATVGLFLSLLVILGTRLLLGPQFDVWGWRIPFLISALLLAVSVYIRLQLQESPVFKRMKAEGKGSKAPFTESFLRWGNLKIVLLVLFGGVAGQAVVWYTGMFYELFFLTQTLKVEPHGGEPDGRGRPHPRHAVLHRVRRALRQDRPQVDHHGRLRDRGAHLLPDLQGAHEGREPGDLRGGSREPHHGARERRATAASSSIPIGKAKFNTSCDIAKSWLAKKYIPYTNEAVPAGTVASVTVGGATIESFDGRPLAPAEFKARQAAFDKQMADAVKAAGYPAKADMSKVNTPMVVFLLFLLALYVTIVYAPIAAWLVELFPAKHPLHLDVAAVPHRQRLVRRLPPDDRVRDGRRDGRHLLRPLVPDRHRRDDRGHRLALHAGDQGPRHPLTYLCRLSAPAPRRGAGASLSLVAPAARHPDGPRSSRRNMNSSSKLRTAAAAAGVAIAQLARAGGDATGTEAVGQMQVSGGTFALMVGGVVGLGVVVWLVTKFVSK